MSKTITLTHKQSTVLNTLFDLFEQRAREPTGNKKTNINKNQILKRCDISREGLNIAIKNIHKKLKD